MLKITKWSNNNTKEMPNTRESIQNRQLGAMHSPVRNENFSIFFTGVTQLFSEIRFTRD